MANRETRITKFKQAVIESSSNPDFIHHPWFVNYHLEIVERLAEELLPHYPQADADLVRVMVWLHDYGKTIDFPNQYQTTLTAGRAKLTEIGFEPEFIERAVANIEIMDKKLTVDLNKAPIEVQIVASADGCSHFVGPFMSLWWWENHGKNYHELMADTIRKVAKDWDRKITLPEARAAFAERRRLILEQSGEFPEHFLWSVIDELLASTPEPDRAELERLRRLVHSTVPDAEEVKTYGMPGFKYRGKYLCSFAAFRNHLSFFPGALPTDIAVRLTTFTLSRGTIQFTREHPIPDAVIRDLLNRRRATIESR